MPCRVCGWRLLDISGDLHHSDDDDAEDEDRVGVGVCVVFSRVWVGWGCLVVDRSERLEGQALDRRGAFGGKALGRRGPEMLLRTRLRKKPIAWAGVRGRRGLLIILKFNGSFCGSIKLLIIISNRLLCQFELMWALSDSAIAFRIYFHPVCDSLCQSVVQYGWGYIWRLAIIFY